MGDGLVEALALQVAQLREEVQAMQEQLDESGGDSMDDVFLHIKGGGVGGGDDAGAFRFEGDKITHCNFYAAHAVHHLADVTVEEGDADGTWYLNVPHASPGSATVSKSAGDNDDDHTAIKLFTIRDGAVVDDCRGMPFVPIYS